MNTRSGSPLGQPPRAVVHGPENDEPRGCYRFAVPCCRCMYDRATPLRMVSDRCVDRAQQDHHLSHTIPRRGPIVERGPRAGSCRRRQRVCREVILNCDESPRSATVTQQCKGGTTMISQRRTTRYTSWGSVSLILGLLVLGGCAKDEAGSAKDEAAQRFSAALKHLKKGSSGGCVP